MRWTDVPGEGGGQADGRDSAEHRRAQWAELRQRLERLPPGHPSSPEQDERDSAGQADGLPEPAAAGEPEHRTGRGAEAEPDRRADGDLGPAGERSGGGRQDQGLVGRHDPYRPWFTDGEPAQPWFADEPG
jgi:hypothetical protein